MAVDEKEPGKPHSPESEMAESETPVASDEQPEVPPQDAGSSEQQTAGHTPAAPAANVVQPKTGRFTLLLLLVALLLGLSAFGLSGWQYYRQSAAVAVPDNNLDKELAQMKATLAAGQRELQQARAGLQQTLQADIRKLEQTQASQLRSLEQTLQQQRERLLALDGTDRDDWSLAEVEYLLRLANQRLVMASDLRSAKSLLTTADGIIKELDDSSLHGVRAAIAADLAALRAIPEVDVQGIWLRIQALVGQVDKLVLFELPDYKSEEPPPSDDGGWRERMQHGIRAALARLSSYVIVRRRDAPYEALLDPQWEGMVRQNLRMLLEQSRAALLSGNQTLYRESLANSQRWLGEFFSFSEDAVAAIDTELDDLQRLNIEQGRGDLSQSLAAVKVAIDEKHQVGGEQ